MANSLGTAYVQIVPSAQGISGSITKAIQPEATKAGSTGGMAIIGKMKGLLAGAAIGTALVTGIKKSVGEGAALQQSLGGIETLFKGSADTVIKNARKAYKSAGVSANEYMENVTSFSASLISSLDGDTAKAADVADMAIRDMSDNANKMGTDISSIQMAYQGFARGQYQLLDNLKLGYGGTKTEMERLLEDAGKISGQKYDMSNLNDVYEAIHVIQKDLDITGTTAKEASETISGSFASMGAAFTDLMGNLAMGENVEESMQNLIETTKTFLVDNLIPMIVQIFQSLPAAISGAIKGASGIIPQDMVGVMQNVLDAITAKLPLYLAMGVQMLTNLGNGIIQDLPNLMIVAGQIVESLATFIEQNYPKMGAAAGTLFINLVKSLIMNLPKLAIAWARMQISFTKAFLKLSTVGLKAGIQFIKQVGIGIARMIAPVVGKIKAFVDKITAPFKNAVDKIKSFFPINLGSIVSKLRIPQLKVSGGKAPWGIGGQGTLPNIHWAAEGAIINSKRIIGIGAGEAGDEAIVPLTPFWRRMEEMRGGNTFNITMNVDGAKNPTSWAREFGRSLQLEMRSV